MAKADINNYRDSDTEQLLKLKRCVKVGHVFIEISYKLHKFIYLIPNSFNNVAIPIEI
jgi:hypothetical protein